MQTDQNFTFSGLPAMLNFCMFKLNCLMAYMYIILWKGISAVGCVTIFICVFVIKSQGLHLTHFLGVDLSFRFICRVVNVSSTAGKLSQLSQELQKKFSSPTLTEEGLISLMDQFVQWAFLVLFFFNIILLLISQPLSHFLLCRHLSFRYRHPTINIILWKYRSLNPDQ